MSIQLDLLHNETRNIYEVTCAITERAGQLARLKEHDPTCDVRTPVSEAITEVLKGDVIYQMESD